jgi:hypothetical protein
MMHERLVEKSANDIYDGSDEDLLLRQIQVIEMRQVR